MSRIKQLISMTEAERIAYLSDRAEKERKQHPISVVSFQLTAKQKAKQEAYIKLHNLPF